MYPTYEIKNNNMELYYLMKFGEERYLKNLINFGEIYLNTIEYFKKSDDITINDNNEGAAFIHQGDLKIFNPDNNELIGYAPTAQLRFFNKTFNGNLYCMFGLTSEIENKMKINNLKVISIDERMYKQKDTENKKCVIITNPKEFLNRIESKLNAEKLEYEFHMVEYYNEKEHSGKLDIFNKSNKFEYQSEFRLFVNSNKNKPMCINIGAIKDIAIFVDDCKQLSYGFK